ncbi:hypothetical protein GH714_015984 [Hevea brasiliensis]|uniref:Uncharacterized protein n=1 Tax=Hevea brasiliensis TaxID=3981 RepID=A0A6A6K5K0_HEVBR|nr:hypothetical protein GH714_015984 [Hevea brasiliensis]
MVSIINDIKDEEDVEINKEDGKSVDVEDFSWCYEENAKNIGSFDEMQESDQEFVEEYQVFDLDKVDVKELASKESDAVGRENLTTDLNISKDSHLAGLLDLKGISGGDVGYLGPSNSVATANVKAIAKLSANASVLVRISF